MTTGIFPGMPGILEIGIILLILVLLFGATKLPQLARSLGASLAEFKKGRQKGMDGPSENSQPGQEEEDTQA